VAIPRIQSGDCFAYARNDTLVIMKPIKKLNLSCMDVHNIKAQLRKHKLHTVCEEARCPNLGECFSRGTATFMILGNTCTRSCRFCNVRSTLRQAQGERGAQSLILSLSKDELLSPPDPQEPASIARMVSELKLKHVVITSVTRDDLPDEGAGHFAATIKALRSLMVSLSNHGQSPILRQAQDERPITIEVLTPDFHARPECLKTVCDAGPDIFNHNIETVRRLTPAVRSHADFDRSLKILGWIKNSYSNIITKSGIMVGLGESMGEINATLNELKNAGCEMVTIGQYLAPSKTNAHVEKYYSEEEFRELKVMGENIGITSVFSGVFVRSSYMAEQIFVHGSAGSG